MPRQLPSQEQLRELLHYVPETGELFWKERPRSMFKSDRAWKSWNTKYAGKPAFTSITDAGYRQGSINDQNLLAHRVIWKWMTGEDPDHIDHEEGNRGDNRWSLLKEGSKQQNHLNMKLFSNNSSGVPGVSFDKKRGRWRARIVLTGQDQHLGYFDDLEAAVEARKAAEKQYGFHQNHGRS